MNGNRDGKSIHRVLIAEDDRTQREQLCETLEGEGFDAIGCSNASEALEHLKKGGVDVVIIDLRLPDASERDLLEVIGASSKDVPVIIHTAYASYESAKEAVNFGVFAYLEKGGEPDDLLRQVHRAVQTRLVRRTETLEEAVAERTRDLHEANAALRDSEVSNRAILDAIPDMMFRLSRDGTHLDFQAADPARLYVAPDQIIGKTVGELLPADVAAEYMARIRRTFHHQAMEIFEYQLDFPEEMRYFEARMVPCGDDSVLTFVREITERKEAEETLRKSEARLAEAQRIAHLGDWEVDLTSGEVTWSDELYRILQVDPDTPLDLDTAMREIPHPDDRALAQEAFQRAIATGDMPPFEFRSITGEGEERVLWSKGKVTKNAHGEPVRFVGIDQDVTEWKQKEKELRRREEFGRIMIQVSSTLVDVGNLDAGINNALEAIGRFCTVDRAYVFMVRADGKTIDNTHEWCCDGIEPQADNLQEIHLERELPWFWSYMRNGKTFHVAAVRGLPPEAQLEKEHFEEQDIQALIVVPMVCGNELIGFMGFDSVRAEKTWSEDDAGLLRIAADTVARAVLRRRVEEALAKSVEEFRNVVENANDIVYSLTLEGEFTYVSPNARELLGYHPTEVLGRPFADFIHPDDQPRCNEFFQSVISTGEKASGIEYRARHQDGSWRWHTSNASAQKDKSNHVVAFVGISRDATERKQQRDRMQLSLDILQHLNSGGDKRALIAGILERIKQYTGAEAVGIRLREGDDFPYYETNGFPDHFVEKERYLCARDDLGEVIRDLEGNAVLECMCGNVLCERIDPSKPFYTQGGSFWTNSTTELLASASNKDLLARPRSRCNKEVYESLALIPVCSNGETIGLLQLNDRRPGQLTIDLIEFLESLGHSIGIALHRADATDALEASEARYKSLVENSLVGVNVLQDGRIVFANQAMAAIMGYSVAELCSLTPAQVRELFHPDDQKMVYDRAKARLAGENPPSRYVFRAVRKDGSVAWLDHAVSLTSFDGRPASQGFSLDITERKHAEEALQESREMLEQQLAELNHLYDTSPAGFCVLDTDLRYLRINNVLAAINGRPASEHIGRTLAEVLPELADHLVPICERVIKTGQPELNFEVHGITPAEPDVEKDWLVSYYPIKPNRGETLGVGTVVQDITDRKKAEAQLRQRDAQLAHLGRLSTMGEMAIGIAHELNQPLYAITNYVAAISGQLQRLGSDSADLIEMLDKASGQVRRAAEIIKRLRNTVRKCEPRRSTTNVNDLIDEVVELMGHELRHHTVTVYCDLQKDLPLLLVDSIQIQQVVLNLVRNAMDAMRDVPSNQRELTLHTSAADGGMIEVRVSDTGEGMSDETRRRLFDAFFTTKIEGLGMGLAISRSIIEAHGGQITAAPNSPHGTIFRFAIEAPERGHDNDE